MLRELKLVREMQTEVGEELKTVRADLGNRLEKPPA
jgi:hypothetical protein